VSSRNKGIGLGQITTQEWPTKSNGTRNYRCDFAALVREIVELLLQENYARSAPGRQQLLRFYPENRLGPFLKTG
jgi:hypothetical protein